MTSKSQLIQELLETPSSKEANLGDPLPNTSNAVSVSMPLMKHVFAYEEGDEKVINKFKLGYPRFFLHPKIKSYFESQLLEKDSSLSCFCFPSEKTALRAISFAESEAKECFPCSIEETKEGLFACFFNKKYEIHFKAYWQHAGEIISARFFEEKPSAENEKLASKKLKERIASYSKQTITSDVYLFPSGMAAFFLAVRASTNDFKNSRVAQIGFPYVDSLKIIEKFCEKHYLFPLLGADPAIRNKDINDTDFNAENADEGDYQKLEELASSKNLDAVFIEYPTNAVLSVPSLERISNICKEHSIPLVIDATIAGFYNFDLSEYGDLIVTSLTKFFSGKGDVLAGTLVDSSSGRLTKNIKDYFEDLTEPGDLVALEENSRTYEENFSKMQVTAQTLAEFLDSHDKIQTVNYPGLKSNKVQNENYSKILRENLRRDNNGYGALLSLELKDVEKTALFYDKLNFSKGPSFGTEFSLVCAYTLLAHYHELDWVRECGVSDNLLRVSVGLEGEGEIIRRFEEALAEI